MLWTLPSQASGTAMLMHLLLLRGYLVPARFLGRNSIKSRLQVQKYNGVVDCAQKIYKHEGLGGFFRGTLKLPAPAVPSATRSLPLNVIGLACWTLCSRLSCPVPTGLAMPLATITLVRTVSFTIYDRTKKAGCSSTWVSAAGRADQLLDPRNVALGGPRLQVVQPRQFDRESKLGLRRRLHFRLAPVSRDVRFRAGESQVAARVHYRVSTSRGKSSVSGN